MVLPTRRPYTQPLLASATAFGYFPSLSLSLASARTCTAGILYHMVSTSQRFKLRIYYVKRDRLRKGNKRKGRCIKWLAVFAEEHARRARAAWRRRTRITERAPRGFDILNDQRALDKEGKKNNEGEGRMGIKLRGCGRIKEIREVKRTEN